jgi:hypothetical protein
MRETHYGRCGADGKRETGITEPGSATGPSSGGRGLRRRGFGERSRDAALGLRGEPTESSNPASIATTRRSVRRGPRPVSSASSWNGAALSYDPAAPTRAEAKQAGSSESTVTSKGAVAPGANSSE